MLLLSCVNCAFNALQSGSLGPTVGYCTEHKRVLNTPTELTCGRHFRKDLPLIRANSEHDAHEKHFTNSEISDLMAQAPAEPDRTSAAEADVQTLRRDLVASEVTDYGLLGTKIESLARLSRLPGARAEVALSCLSRVYVRRCITRGGAWTSGLHVFWWIKGRLQDEPEIDVNDLRDSTPLSLSRRVDLAKWSVVFMRLLLLSDIGTHAKTSGFRGRRVRIHRLSNLVEQAALGTGDLSLSKLMRWIRREGARLVDEALPPKEYQRLSRELHKETA